MLTEDITYKNVILPKGESMVLEYKNTLCNNCNPSEFKGLQCLKEVSVDVEALIRAGKEDGWNITPNGEALEFFKDINRCEPVSFLVRASENPESIISEAEKFVTAFDPEAHALQRFTNNSQNGASIYEFLDIADAMKEALDMLLSRMKGVIVKQKESLLWQ